MVARQQLGRTLGVLIALHVAPAFLGIGRGLGFVIVRNIVEHEALALFVAQNSAFAAHPFGDQNAHDARRPDHAGGMKLDEFHVQQFGPGVVGQRDAVACAFPGIAGHAVSPAQSAGGQHHRLGLENAKAPALPVVAQRADHAGTVFQQRDHGVLHVHGDPLVNAVVLERANQFEPGAVAHVGEARVTVAAEITLQDFPILGAVKHRAPRLQFMHARRSFFGMQLGHAPVVDVLPAAHRIGKVHFPVVAVIHIAHGGRHPAFGHDGVRLAQQRFADQADFDAGG